MADPSAAERGPGTPSSAAVGRAIAAAVNEAPSRRNENVVLLMFSGGLDSSALLANLLEHTDDRVHAHHVALHNPHGRGDAEQVATDAVVAWCREHHRHFEFSQSVHRFMLPAGGGWDTTLFLFAAARVCTALGGLVNLVATGHIRPAYRHLLEAEAVFHACMTNKRRRPTWIRPFTHLPGTMGEAKAVVEASIPAELAALTWWCRRPVVSGDGWAVCGECHACRNMAAAGAADPAGGRARTGPIP